MDRRVLVPIETGCLLLRAVIVRSNLIFAVSGDRHIAASVTLIALAVTVMVVHRQVLEIIGPRGPRRACWDRVPKSGDSATAVDGSVPLRSARSRLLYDNAVLTIKYPRGGR